MSVQIYHNPRCSKSRQTLQLLEDNGISPEIIEYLQTPPDTATLAGIVAKLGVSVDDIMRTGEDQYKASKEAVTTMDDAGKLAWLCDNPKVIQRPIVINGEQARIGRPPESVLDII